MNLSWHIRRVNCVIFFVIGMGCGTSRHAPSTIPKRTRKQWIRPKEERDLNGDDFDAFKSNLDLILKTETDESEPSSKIQREWKEQLEQQCRFLRENPTYQQHELMGNDAPFNTPPWFDATQARSYLRHGRGMVIGVVPKPVRGLPMGVGFIITITVSKCDWRPFLHEPQANARIQAFNHTLKLWLSLIFRHLIRHIFNILKQL